MKCISLHQPWASLVVVGAKRYETRHWSTAVRGQILIHAAKKWNRDLVETANSDPFFAALHLNGAWPLRF
jgi:hypothetical protein